MAGRILLLCHDGSWDRLYQGASCAASASAQDLGVDMVFFFAALEKLLDGRLDEFTPTELVGRYEAMSLEIGTRRVSAMLADARATGELRLYACSASLALLRRPIEAAQAAVDEIIGWPTVIRMLGKASSVLYL